MKKFYLKNGKEVHIGDTIVKTFKSKHPICGESIITQRFTVTESILSELLDAGIIVSKSEKPVENKCKVSMKLEYYIQKIAEKLDWNYKKAYNYINNAGTIFPAAALSMILREIAIELDKKYEDHISNSPEIYVISLLDGRIAKANKAHIKNYRNFAAFRSVDDAKIACSIVKNILKEMFKCGK